MCRAGPNALKSPLFRPQVAEDGFHLWLMPKLALGLVFAATAIIAMLAAIVLSNVVLPVFRLQPSLLAGLVMVAGSGLTAGLALLEWGSLKALQAPGTP